jgi:membrane associated rhomboid family serine protease
VGLFWRFTRYGLIFPNSPHLYLFFAPIKAKWFVLIYAALEFWFGVSGAGDNVAHFAHLGGMIFGYLLLLYWHKKEHRYY